MSDDKYLWKRVEVEFYEDFVQDCRNDKEDVHEFAIGNTIGIHMLGRDWMTMDEIFEAQKGYEKDFPDDFTEKGVCRREVENTIQYLWLMGYVERKKVS